MPGTAAAASIPANVFESRVVPNVVLQFHARKETAIHHNVFTVDVIRSDRQIGISVYVYSMAKLEAERIGIRDPGHLDGMGALDATNSQTFSTPRLGSRRNEIAEAPSSKDPLSDPFHEKSALSSVSMEFNSVPWHELT